MWAFAIKQKMTAAALLFAVIVLVMLTNMREQRTAARISTAVTSLYEDRLVVAQYILQLTRNIDNIIVYLEKDELQNSTKINAYLKEVNTLIRLYEQTTLTETEKVNFEHFKILCQNITGINTGGDYASMLPVVREAEVTLQTLSSIQIEEGKNKLDEVLDMTYFSNLFSYLELGILIVIAIIIQVLVFASKTMANVKTRRNEHLN